MGMSTSPKPATNKLRVWCITNLDSKIDQVTSFPKHTYHWPVESIHEAYRLIEAVSFVMLDDDFIISNVFGLEVLNDETNEWEEWEDQFGYGITEDDVNLNDPIESWK
jgi:hypothetical protein